MNRTVALVVGLVALTVANVLVRVVRGRPEASPPPWEFEIGRRFPDLRLQSVDGSSAPVDSIEDSGCQLLVVFDTQCEHCHTARLVEAAIPDSIRLPVTWVTVQTDETVARFADGLSSTSRVRTVSRSDLETVVVRVTPVVFVLGRAREVVLIAPYAGTAEQHGAFKGYCEPK